MKLSQNKSRSTQQKSSNPLFVSVFLGLLIGSFPGSGGANTNADNPPSIRRKDTHIAIVGGGISGLSAAFWLTEKGFHNITLYEADPEVGGKVQSYRASDGSIHEVGAIVQSPDFENIFEIARRTGYAIQEDQWLVPFPKKTLVLNSRGERISTFLTYEPPRDVTGSWTDRYSLADELGNIGYFNELRRKLGTYRDLQRPGFEPLLNRASKDVRYDVLYDDLLEPMETFMSRVSITPPFWQLPPSFLNGPRDLRSTLGRFSLFFNITGYGFTSEVPALYHMKFLRMTSNAGIRLAFGLSPMTTAKKGYQDLLRHLASYLTKKGVQLRLSHYVHQITRPVDSEGAGAGWSDALSGSGNVTVDFESDRGKGSSRFDVAIIATPPGSALGFLKDLSPLDRHMLSATRYYNFITTIFEDRGNSLAKWKRTTLWVENDGSNIFTAYQFAPTPDVRAVTDDELQTQLVSDLRAMGGDIRKEWVLVTRQWKNYFPHFSSETLKSDPEGKGRFGAFLPRFLAMQARRSTLYLMATFDFDSTEHLAGYSRSLVDRYFE